MIELIELIHGSFLLTFSLKTIVLRSECFWRKVFCTLVGKLVSSISLQNLLSKAYRLLLNQLDMLPGNVNWLPENLGLSEICAPAVPLGNRILGDPLQVAITNWENPRAPQYKCSLFTELCRYISFGWGVPFLGLTPKGLGVLFLFMRGIFEGVRIVCCYYCCYGCPC